MSHDKHCVNNYNRFAKFPSLYGCCQYHESVSELSIWVDFYAVIEPWFFSLSSLMNRRRLPYAWSGSSITASSACSRALQAFSYFIVTLYISAMLFIIINRSVYRTCRCVLVLNRFTYQCTVCLPVIPYNVIQWASVDILYISYLEHICITNLWSS